MEKHEKMTAGLGYFNLARGLGIILVVLGHSINLFLPSSADISVSGIFSGTGSAAGAGVMAAFFMISGSGFFRRSPGKCMRLQFRLLIHPYLWTAAAVIATKIALAVIEKRSFLNHGAEMIPTYLFGLNAEGGGRLFGFPIDSVSILWFLLALFGGWILYNWIRQTESKYLHFIFAAVCTAAGWIMTVISPVWPYCLPIMLLTVGFLWAGELIRDHNLLERRLPAWCWAVIGIPALCSILFGQVNIVAGIWKLGPIDVFGVFCWGFIILRIYALFMKKGHLGCIAGFIEETGFHSIWIVCLHAYEKVIVPWYRLAGMFETRPVLGICLCFAARCAVMYILYRAIVFILYRIRKKKRKKLVLTD